MMSDSGSGNGRKTPAKLASALVIAAVLVSSTLILPVAYQTNDDPTCSEVFHGDRILGIAPDAHCQYVHFFIGWIVSSLSRAHPSIAWYGLLMAAMYVLAFTVITTNLPVFTADPSMRKRLMAFLIFGAAFVLFPLVLFQFTILAGLLATAGLVPCVHLALRGQTSNSAMWIAAAVCLLFGFMFRFQMAAVILVLFLPALGLALFFEREWRSVGLCLAFLASIGLLGLGLYGLDARSYRAAPAFERFHEYRMMESAITDRVTVAAAGIPARALSRRVDHHRARVDHDLIDQGEEEIQTVVSANDLSMITEWLAINSGPLELEHLRRIGESPAVIETVAGAEVDDQQVSTSAPEERETQEERATNWKLEGILKGRNARHIRLTSYLIVVLGSGFVLMVASAIIGAWRVSIYSWAIASGAVVFSALSSIVLDRAVFRVLFPCAYVFLIISIMVFPWSHLRFLHQLARWKRWLLTTVTAVFFSLLGAGVVLAGVQIRQNRIQLSIYQEMLRTISTTIGTQHTVIAWPLSLHIEHGSPFERVDSTLQGIFRHGLMSSHPHRLGYLKHRFGDDVYTGLGQPRVAHLISVDQLAILKTFYSEHYGRRLEAVRLGSFFNGEEEISAWTLRDLQDDE